MKDKNWISDLYSVKQWHVQYASYGIFSALFRYDSNADILKLT